MNPWHFFDNIYYINLASRSDRERQLLSEFARAGINNPKRVEAFFGPDKWLAFNCSQYRALSGAQGEAFMIFEDDCRFSSFNHLQPALESLPENWDMIYLGANILEDKPAYVAPYLRKLTNAWTTHAVGYSRKCAEWILANWDYKELPIFDEWLRLNVLPRGNCYIVSPMICDQTPGFSDIWQTDVEYGFLKEGNKKMEV